MIKLAALMLETGSKYHLAEPHNISGITFDKGTEVVQRPNPFADHDSRTITFVGEERSYQD